MWKPTQCGNGEWNCCQIPREKTLGLPMKTFHSRVGLIWVGGLWEDGWFAKIYRATTWKRTWIKKFGQCKLNWVHFRKETLGWILEFACEYVETFSWFMAGESIHSNGTIFMRLLLSYAELYLEWCCDSVGGFLSKL